MADDINPAIEQIARDAARKAVREVYEEIAKRLWRPAPEYLTPEMAAAYLSVSVETMKQWRAQGYGPKPVTTQHKFVRYRRADLDAWMEGLDAASDAGE